MPRALIAGTRGSRLALRQTELVIKALRLAHTSLDIHVREIRTEGDRSQAPLSAIGGQGVFVKEIEASLLRKEIDFAVHSLKDLPPEVEDGLVLAAIPERGDPRDALATRGGVTLADLGSGARIGTGSARRAAQLRGLRHDIETSDIRGNVETRIRKVDEGPFEGVVIACAGLERLGLLHRASQTFSFEEMLPAAGQGALAVEARADDEETQELLSKIDHSSSHLACEAERALLAELGAGCRLPVGALARVEATTIQLSAWIWHDEANTGVRLAAAGGLSEGIALGRSLGQQVAARVSGGAAS